MTHYESTNLRTRTSRPLIRTLDQLLLTTTINIQQPNKRAVFWCKSDNEKFITPPRDAANAKNQKFDSQEIFEGLHSPSSFIGVVGVLNGRIWSGLLGEVRNWSGPSYPCIGCCGCLPPPIFVDIPESGRCGYSAAVDWTIPGVARFCFMYASINWRCIGQGEGKEGEGDLD